MADPLPDTDPFKRLRDLLVLLTEGGLSIYNWIVIVLLLFFLGVIALLMILFGRQ